MLGIFIPIGGYGAINGAKRANKIIKRVMAPPICIDLFRKMRFLVSFTSTLLIG